MLTYIHVCQTEIIMYATIFSEIKDSVLNPSSQSDSIYVKHEPYIPDFSMKAQDNILFLRIKRSHYIVARRATLMGRSKNVEMKDEEAFTKEWKKVSQLVEKRNDLSVEKINEVLNREMTEASMRQKFEPYSLENLKRTDSKESGWSFSVSDRHNEGSDMESSKHDTSFTHSEDIVLNDIHADVKTNSDTDFHTKISDNERTSGGKGEVTINIGDKGDNLTREHEEESNDELNSGESTPLVIQPSQPFSQ